MNLEQASPTIAQYRQKKQKIVLVTGVFDLLHQHHFNFLVAANKQADRLVVGIESDTRVKQIKGPERPIYNQTQRLKNLENLGLLDLVFILPEDFSTPQAHQDLIKQIRPAVLAVSAHTKHLEAKQKILAANGGQVEIVYPHQPETSTSQLLTHFSKVEIENRYPVLEFNRPVISSTQIETGQARGRLLGFPTLNLVIPEVFDYPLGIYAGKVRFSDQEFYGAFHWGPIPTYKQHDLHLEVFVLEQDIQKTPDKIEFELNYKIRDIIKFGDSSALKTQIEADVALIKDLLEQN